MSFVQEIWQSVFEPGTNASVIKATHGSFVLLVLSLSWMIYHSGSIHFVNLLVISLALWGTVTWFLAELEKEKQKGTLKTNEELMGEEGKEEEKKDQ
ncbi:Pkr1 protein [Martiniozyma asiatica (nom. inval.)]|nr:Pkr1 protein [Martiniozyma asiatica]